MRALLAFALLLAAVPAAAEPVTYHLTGTVIAVSDGSSNSLDLRSIFPSSAAITLDITVQRSTAPFTLDNIVYIYTNPGTALSFTVGSYACSGALANVVAVVNDQPGGPGAVTDLFDYQASSLIGPPVLSTNVSALQVDLGDNDGTAFSSGTLPRPMPALSTFENRTLTLTYEDDVLQKAGVVVGLLDAVATPARGTSWGRIRADYR